MIMRKGMEPANKGRTFPAETLAPAEAGALIGAASLRSPTGTRNRAMLALLYASGLRVGELLSIRPADVNMTKHSIRVLATKSQQAQTRGFAPQAADALTRWLERRHAPRNAPLFCTLDGTPLSQEYVRAMVRRMAARAGIERRVTPHTLRHSYAAELERQGTPVTVISKLLGHSSVAVTARYLDHLTNAQAVEALDDVTLEALENA